MHEISLFNFSQTLEYYIFKVKKRPLTKDSLTRIPYGIYATRFSTNKRSW